MKFVGSIEFDNDNDVLTLTHLIFMKSNANLARTYPSDIPNFILIGHKKAEIHSREVNNEL